MATRYHQQQTEQPRPPTRRQPLGPGDARANMNPTQHTSDKAAYTSPSTALPSKKNAEVVEPQPTQSSPTGSGRGNKRVSDIKKDTQRSTKRDSEISNASSTASGGTRKRTIGQWQLGRTVGRGGCSTVRLVRHVVTGQVGAVKIISRKMAEQVRAQSLANLAAAPDPSMNDLVAAGKAMPPPPPGLMREIAIMKLLDHPNIVRLHDVWENHNELYLVMEYVQGGELFHYVEECRGLDEKETVYIFRQIIAALLYCHRLHIHHRDLKPENILLDRENAQVKLVDFGMAALQPEGKQLTTACGSPHYAAPEVIRSRPYDGAKADVWSCGVILYVMLTGTTPFNYDHERNLAVMYHAIAMADYYMPPELSFQAKDLLRKIFVPRPDKRISMDEIWEHPLLHKYDHEFGYEGELAKKDAWIGPVPKLEQWSVTREEDIDKEIVRNMRTLWHSVPQHILIQKLLSKQPNQEKYFYAALLKHREENLENYTGGPEGVAHSNSDYQHAKTADQTETPAIPTTQQSSRSSYSIMNNEHLRSCDVDEVPPPPSDGSYDPYRPGRYPTANKPTSQTRTVVHRRDKSGSAKGAALRVETLKKANRQATTARKQSPMPAAHSRTHSRSMSRSSINRASRQSLTSSVWASSPPVALPVRSVSAHKRNVSFQHVRKSSVASAVTNNDPAAYTPELQQKALATQKEIEEETTHMSSPTPKAERRKSRTPAATPRGRTRRNESNGHIIRNEVRKVSSELEKACEEAFFRSSYGSSQQRSSYTEPRSPYDTPPSSISGQGDSAKRPLPAVPTDTPNTFIARTLEETRSKLAARSAADGDGDAARYHEVLAKLESLMPTAEYERRVTSAPEPKSATDLGFLPIITEEALPDTNKAGRGDVRSFTAPHASKQVAPVLPQDTIRVVEASPQNSRGHSHEYRRASAEDISRPRTSDGTKNNGHLQVPGPHDNLLRKHSHDSAVGLKMPGSRQDDVSVLPLPETINKKKPSWFKRWKDGKEPQQTQAISSQQTSEPHPGVPVQYAELDDRSHDRVQPSQITREKQPPQPLKLERPPIHTAISSASSDFPVRRSPDNNESKFSKWFGKLPGAKKDDAPRAVVDLKDTLPAPNPMGTTPSSPFGAPTTPISPKDATTQSWFSRFLRLKPEQRILCFSVPRGRARAETYRLLRDWQRHGIADLCYYPQENMITARVDKNNALGIKPVSFRVELFVVLQNGKKVGLSLGRWTQTRGAASSFKEVVRVFEQSMCQKQILVENEEQCKELEGILA